ncbi:GTPase HflX [Pseudogracilibacillus auburnensis]|uniref:GTPase HflX n=1 Tax=Pseudogracilibacillus auburnensis TaxID=1494959 RepID=UPI001A971B99|nr:GTPase HflX [Pseudogracilibacillus auburnensis]MBO1004344.1 GTPase HflX [Pseudogracilibacillus auburnensis]
MAKENVLIIAVKKGSETDDHYQSSVQEIKSLSYTAGGNVVEIVTQNRVQIHPVTYVGEGKLEEVKQRIIQLDIELVIANDELSPGQLRNLNDHFGIRVIDRSQLILDIFASRAKTKEGQLQVELAQLEYTLPRLHGMGLVMSRLGGGIGTRGPGETKLETDQRHIRRRIDDIKRRLKDVVKQREQYRKRRKLNQVFQIAIVGYTNAGKSTIFNRLTNESALEEDLLFATLDPLTRQIHLPSGFKVLLTDTVGFLQDLPTSLIAAFKSTLEEVREADFLLHVVDASHEGNEEQQNTVMQILRELDAHTIPMLTVYNKSDLLQEDFIPLHHPYIVMSAYDEKDQETLVLKIEEVLKQEWDQYSISLKPDKGRLMNQLGTHTIVTRKQYNENKNQYDLEGFIPQIHPLQSMVKEQDNVDDK